MTHAYSGSRLLFPAFWFARKTEIGISCYHRRTPRNLSPLLKGFPLADKHNNGPADDVAADSENKTLNFKVSLEFKKEFKGFAGSQGITMTDLLKEGFALTKKKRQK